MVSRHGNSPAQKVAYPINCGPEFNCASAQNEPPGSCHVCGEKVQNGEEYMPFWPKRKLGRPCRRVFTADGQKVLQQPVPFCRQPRDLPALAKKVAREPILLPPPPMHFICFGGRHRFIKRHIRPPNCNNSGSERGRGANLITAGGVLILINST